jgi:dTDP-4-dehydrorhamnose reductase
MTRSILVTGATGLLGGTLTRRWREEGRPVLTHGHSKPADHRADLADAAAARGLLVAADPAFVVNCAGLTNVDACEQDRHGAYLANGLATENLARACREHGATLLHLSTDQVYATPGPSPEEAVTVSNVYGLSKLAGEAWALGLGYTVLRTNLIGPSDTEGRVSQSDWYLNALRGEQPVTFFDDIHFNPLRMTTVAAALARVMEDPEPGLFNLTATEGLSKAGFGLALAEYFRLPRDHVTVGKSTDIPQFAGRPKDTQGDPARFVARWGALPTLREEAEALVAEYAERER